MYWVFADSQHLIEVIASQTLPTEIVHSGVHFGESADGEIWVQPRVAIPRIVARKLKEKHVRAKRQTPVFHWMNLFHWFARPSWWQIVPPHRREELWENDPNQPVILQVTPGEELVRTMREILRLGGKLRGVALPAEPKERALLTAQRLPYFSRLAATDQTLPNPQQLFLFHNSQVAIEAGYSHPLADQIVVPEDHLLLLTGKGGTSVVERSRFRKLTPGRLLPFPSNAPKTFARKSIDSIPVRLRLVSRSSPEPPSLWVIPLTELRAWVRGAEQRLLEQFTVAILPSSDSPRVVVRPLNEKRPPVLLWESLGFCASRSVSGLYLPWNRDLHPAIRSEAIQTVLECGEEKLTWISEETENPLCVQSVSRSGFQPLMAWIEYELPHPAEPFQPWSPESPLEFERFQVLDEPRQRTVKPKREPVHPEDKENLSWKATRSQLPRSRKPSKPKVNRPTASPSMQRDHREARKRLAELQKNVRAKGLPLDTEEHSAAWLEMTGLHFLLRQGDQGIHCLSHALWDGSPPDAAWFQSVWNEWLGKGQGNSSLRILEDVMHRKKPTDEDLSRLVFLLVWHSTGESAESFPRDGLPELREFLTRSEQELPVRVGWLAWVSLLRIAGGDALALARVRDRFLEYLFAWGIRWEHDMPKFLRSGGPGSGTGLTGRSLRLSDFRDVLHEWSRSNGKNTANETRTYLDLVLAFGMARRSETGSAKQLLDSAGSLLRRNRNPLHRWCLNAFEYRIRQVLAAENPTLPLSRELTERFQAFSKHDQFKLHRLRQNSRILEPPRTRDVYRAYREASQDDLARELADLGDIRDSVELAKRFERIQQIHTQPEARFHVMVTGLELSPRMGGTIAERLLNQSSDLLSECREKTQRVQLLEKSLRVAAHYGREEWITRFVSELGRYLDSLRDDEPETVFSMESLVGESFQGMRRFGLRAEMIRLLDQLEQLANEQTTTDNPVKLELLYLQIAGGRFFFEQEERAWPLLDRVREVLRSERLSAIAQTQLAGAYLRTLEFAPEESAGERFWDFFQSIRGISDAYSLNSLVFVSQLSVAEAFVFAITREVNQKDPATRRLLDDEEYCVRRRIHQDLQAVLHDAD